MKTIYIVCADYSVCHGPRKIDVVRAYTSHDAAKRYSNKLEIYGKLDKQYDYFRTYVGSLELEEG